VDVADFTVIKQRQQQVRATGDYATVGNTLVLVSELLCEAVDVCAGQKVPDVATGSGNTALAAAPRWGEVTGIDYVPALLQRGHARATAEGLSVTFQEGDAEQLPFPDGAFDVVLSTFGAMFAPDQEQTARELI
jgi:ubiquinone/menaquinone biosynthesis C-methylase UbiE